MVHNEIVIVGAGPVGLWTAIQLKKRHPSADVIVYERHEEYQRSHVLRLDHWSLLLYSFCSRQASEQKFYREVTGKSVGRVRLGFVQSLYLRTNDLEKALRAYALRENIALVHLKIQDVAQVQARHPHCTFFVAADGAHSPLRQELLGADALSRYELQRVVELKFEEVGEHRRFDIREKWRLNRKLQFAGSEHVGRKRGQSTPVTMRFLVDKAVYEALPEMTFKAPLTVEHPDLPTCIRDDVAGYLRFRETELGTKVVPGTLKLTKLPLYLYAAKHFAVLRETRAWFLVGDAAMGVPYFRALNCGLLLGSRLAMLVGRNGGLAPAQLPRLVARYERRRWVHVAVEFGIARAKDTVLNVFKWARTVGIQA